MPNNNCVVVTQRKRRRCRNRIPVEDQLENRDLLGEISRINIFTPGVVESEGFLQKLVLLTGLTLCSRFHRHGVTSQVDRLCREWVELALNVRDEKRRAQHRNGVRIEVGFAYPHQLYKLPILDS